MLAFPIITFTYRARKVDVPADLNDVHEMIERMLCLDAGARLNIDEVGRCLGTVSVCTYVYLSLGRSLSIATVPIEEEGVEIVAQVIMSGDVGARASQRIVHGETVTEGVEPIAQPGGEHGRGVEAV